MARSVSIPVAAMLLVLAASPRETHAAAWGCYGTKPGHPTADEKAAFIREVSELAIKAEKTHGVPASALAALAIAESGYGWTRLALEANNLFAWKFGSTAAAEGRQSYKSTCRRGATVKDRYVVFRSRADAFDYVAAKLATLDAYREYGNAYKAARARGAAVDPAVAVWLSGIARRYSRKPADFKKKIVRIMNNPVQPSDQLSPEHNLHRLSARPGPGR